MPKQIYKTIIIGAGPAGLTAAKGLKNNYLVLEKKKEIGKPVQCGEGISQRALESQGIEPDDSWISCKIHRAKRIMPNGKAFGKWHKKPLGYIIDRTVFEKHLAKPIIDKIKLNCEVENLEFENGLWKVFTKNNKIYKSKYVVGADGTNSIVRRILFPENQNKIEFSPAIEYLVELEKEISTDEIRMFFDNEKYEKGYTWIFPKSKNTANIGLCGKNIKISDFNEFLEKYVKKNYGNCKLLTNKSGVIPISEPRVSVFKKNAFLIGDAGGFADPFFKGGMNQGMISGKKAADCILSGKTEEYRKKITSEKFLSQKIHRAAKIFYSLDNKVLNELGEVLEGKGMLSYLKTYSGIKNLLLKPNLRKNIINLFLFFNAWWKNRDYLW